MVRKRYTTEQIIGHLRAEVRLAQGQSVGTVCRGIEDHGTDLLPVAAEHGGPKLDQAKRLNATADAVPYRRFAREETQSRS
jgi:putative transposase